MAHQGNESVGGALKVKVQMLPTGPDVTFKIEHEFTLGDVLRKAAEELHEQLYPNATHPSDHLRNQIPGADEFGPPLHLDELVGEFLRRPGTTNHFGIELVLSIRVNARWAIATAESMTPKQILGLPHINLNPDEYTLYKEGSSEILPLDTPIKLHRGEKFDAQKDGKYGGGR